MLDDFASCLEPHHRILLTTHENPDGDAIGSLVGLAHYLRLQGKEIRIVVTPEVPNSLTFLDENGWIEAFEPEGHHLDLAAWPDVWLLVDASEPHRTGKMEKAFKASKAKKVCLDHHLKEKPGGFDMEFTDATASASSELVLEFVTPRMPRPLPLAMATALYAGIVDDTGSFRFSNATPQIHRLAANLIEDGVDPARTFQDLYHQGRPERLRLFGKAFESLRILAEGRYGVISLTQADLRACGADHGDMEGLVNEPLKLKGVEVSALLHELEDGRFKASLRSRGLVDVNAVCRRFGGGGHRLASGAKLDGPLERVQTVVDAAILDQLQVDASPH